MECAAQLTQLEAYYLERRDAQVQIGRLHANIWRLSKGPQMETARQRLRAQIQEHTRRIRELDYLIEKARMRETGLP